MLKVGFIGTGNMGGALAAAVSAAGSVSEGFSILLSNRTRKKAEDLAAGLPNAKVSDNITIAKEADYIFLGVKPFMMEELLRSIAPVLKERAGRGERFTLVSMAAGLSIARIKEMAGSGSYQVIRILPNTPVAVGKGLILCSPDELITESGISEFREMLAAGGSLEIIPENMMDISGTVSGCGPAYVYMFIEAFADGACHCGLPRAEAYRYAAEMVSGAAEMVLKTGRHPAELKDAVCSPKGTTIAGVRALENQGFRSAVMNACIAAYEKTVKHT